MIITRAAGCHAQPFRFTEHELVCDCTHKRCTEERCNLSWNTKHQINQLTNCHTLPYAFLSCPSRAKPFSSLVPILFIHPESRWIKCKIGGPGTIQIFGAPIQTMWGPLQTTWAPIILIIGTPRPKTFWFRLTVCVCGMCGLCSGGRLSRCEVLCYGRSSWWRLRGSYWDQPYQALVLRVYRW